VRFIIDAAIAAESCSPAFRLLAQYEPSGRKRLTAVLAFFGGDWLIYRDALILYGRLISAADVIKMRGYYRR